MASKQSRERRADLRRNPVLQLLGTSHAHPSFPAKRSGKLKPSVGTYVERDVGKQDHPVTEDIYDPIYDVFASGSLGGLAETFEEITSSLGATAVMLRNAIESTFTKESMMAEQARDSLKIASSDSLETLVSLVEEEAWRKANAAPNGLFVQHVEVTNDDYEVSVTLSCRCDVNDGTHFRYAVAQKGAFSTKEYRQADRNEMCRELSFWLCGDIYSVSK